MAADAPRSSSRARVQGAAAAACGGVASGTRSSCSRRTPCRTRCARRARRAERDFAATCAKCGRLRRRPARTARCSSPTGGHRHPARALPHFEPRDRALLRCARTSPAPKACPTGALDRRLDRHRQRARMGLAVIDAENCLSWQGLRCEVCYRVCPAARARRSASTRTRASLSKHAVFVPVVSTRGLHRLRPVRESLPDRGGGGAHRPARARAGAHRRALPAWAGSTRLPRRPAAGAGRRCAAARAASHRRAARDGAGRRLPQPVGQCRDTARAIRHAAKPTTLAGASSFAYRFARRAAPRAGRHAAALLRHRALGLDDRSARPLLQGNLSAASLPGTIPLADPFAALQMLATRHLLLAGEAAGSAPRSCFVAWLLLGGRAFCAWMCPLNVVTDAARVAARAARLCATCFGIPHDDTLRRARARARRSPHCSASRPVH